MQRYTKEELHLTEEEFYQAVKGLFSQEAQELKLFVKGKEIWFFNKDKPQTKELACDLIPVKGKLYLVHRPSDNYWFMTICDRPTKHGDFIDTKGFLYCKYNRAENHSPSLKLNDKVLVNYDTSRYCEAVVVSFHSDGTPVFYSDARSSGFKQFCSDSWYLMD